MIIRKMKDFIIAKYKSCKVENIEFLDNSIRLTLSESFFSNSCYIILMSRTTGKYLKSSINVNVAIFSFNDIKNIYDGEDFDFYIQKVVLDKILRRRLKANCLKQQKNIPLEDYAMNLTFYNTIKNNLSVIVRNFIINYKVKELKYVGNQILCKVKIEEAENLCAELVELIFIKRSQNQIAAYALNKENDSNVFSGYIFIDKLINKAQLNDRWDVFIQFRDIGKSILLKELLILDYFINLDNDENRYIIPNDDILETENGEDAEIKNYIIPYITEGKNSLAFWYVDDTQIKTTYSVKRGQTLFKEMMEYDIEEKMIFFESFMGKNYSGNPKYIYEYMISCDKFKDFKFVWSYTGKFPERIKGDPIIVNRNDKDYYIYLAKSKYWVSNILFPIKIKREGNIYIQTWHGTPLKRLGYDIEIEGPETQARENLYLESRNWDYLIAANKYSDEIFKRAFKFYKEMLTVGYPANDIFYTDNVDSKIEEYKKCLNIPKEKKIILYAPTWRDNNTMSSWNYKFDIEINLKNMKKQFGEEYCILLRMHHLISKNLELDDEVIDFAYDVSDYDDIQELYLISDVLITDYSSVFFDFANTKKPIIFYAYDFYEYSENIRGFYIDMHKDLPGPVIDNEDELFDTLSNVDKMVECYKERYDEFYNRFCSIDDGEASKRIVEHVFGR